MNDDYSSGKDDSFGEIVFDNREGTHPPEITEPKRPKSSILNFLWGKSKKEESIGNQNSTDIPSIAEEDLLEDSLEDSLEEPFSRGESLDEKIFGSDQEPNLYNIGSEDEIISLDSEVEIIEPKLEAMPSLNNLYDSIKPSMRLGGIAVLLGAITTIPFLLSKCGESKQMTLNMNYAVERVTSLDDKISYVKEIINSKFQMPKTGLWNWYLEDTVLASEKKQNDYFTLMDFIGGTEQYLGFMTKKGGVANHQTSFVTKNKFKELKSFVGKSSKKGINTYLFIISDYENKFNPIIKNPDAWKNMFYDLIEYNKKVSDSEKIKGVVLDAEVYTHVVGGKFTKQNQTLLARYEAYNKLAKGNGLEVIPRIDNKWFNVIKFHGEEKAFYKHVIDMFDTVQLSVYRTFGKTKDPNAPHDGFTERARPIVHYFREVSQTNPEKRLDLLFETSDLNNPIIQEIYFDPDHYSRISFNDGKRTYDDMIKIFSGEGGLSELIEKGDNIRVAYHHIGDTMNINSRFISKSESFRRYKK